MWLKSLTRNKSLYSCGFQQNEWDMEFSCGRQGKNCERISFNSISVVWPAYINSLKKGDD